MKVNSVLIIDDSEMDQYLLKRLLKGLDITDEFFQQYNGKDALEFLASHEENSVTYGASFPPKIIFLDINMPLMDGFQFLEAYEKIQSSSDALKTSVVMMFSSSEREDGKNKALSYSFVKDYIVKVPNKAKLLDVFRNYASITGTDNS
jgi:CheY-like chemotaxis protein